MEKTQVVEVHRKNLHGGLQFLIGGSGKVFLKRTKFEPRLKRNEGACQCINFKAGTYYLLEDIPGE